MYTGSGLLLSDRSLATVREFGYGSEGLHRAEQAAAVVVKRTNPCGVAVGDGVATALTRALDGDRISAFGGIVALNAVVAMCSTGQNYSIKPWGAMLIC